MIKFALPAGDLRGRVAELLNRAGLPIEGYGEGSRTYRLAARGRGDVTTRVFREKDIPVQVALGNYDLGVCSISWVKEMSVRFPRQPIVPLLDLGFGRSSLWAAGAQGHCDQLDDLSRLAAVRIASEYPNIAESFARSARLARYRVQSVWGAAEAYPPEDADCVIVPAAGEDLLREGRIQPLFKLFDSSAWLVANALALTKKDLSSVVAPLLSPGTATNGGDDLRLPGPLARCPSDPKAIRRDTVRLAIADAHQQRHAAEALRAAGLTFNEYGDGETFRRPVSGIEGLDVKVIRPHDMPQLIATGEFDLAITGRDCLLEHRYAFPSSPATELLDLQRGQYNLSAVVSEDLPANTLDEALTLWRAEGKAILRVAAEFPVTADHYARSRHFWRYQVIPIAGASEGFVPEDADLLIEGTETGKTLMENNLKAIDLLYRSTTCVIGHRDHELNGRRRRVVDDLINALEESARAAGPV